MKKKLNHVAGEVVSEGIQQAQGILGDLVGFFGSLGGSPSRWTNAAPGVHAFVTAYVPQAMLDWIDKNSPSSLSSIDAIKAIAPPFYMNQGWGLIVSNDPMFSAELTPDVYAKMGIDYWKSLQKKAQVGNTPDQWVKLAGSGGASPGSFNPPRDPQVAAANMGGNWLLIAISLAIGIPMIIGLLRGTNGAK